MYYMFDQLKLPECKRYLPLNPSVKFLEFFNTIKIVPSLQRNSLKGGTAGSIGVHITQFARLCNKVTFLFLGKVQSFLSRLE